AEDPRVLQTRKSRRQSAVTGTSHYREPRVGSGAVLLSQHRYQFLGQEGGERLVAGKLQPASSRGRIGNQRPQSVVESVLGDGRIQDLRHPFYVAIPIEKHEQRIRRSSRRKPVRSVNPEITIVV